MLVNPFLTIPQVESAQSRSWAMGFGFGFQGPSESTMTPADIAPEDVDAFNQGILAGQDAAINGLAFEQGCVDLHAEGPSLPHLAADGTIEGSMTVFGIVAEGFAKAVLDGVLLVVNLSLSLETFSDDPDAALGQQSAAIQGRLQQMGIQTSMELFIGGAVDTAQAGCELLLTSVFRTETAAESAARALGRPQWLVISWRTDQSGSIGVVGFSG
jgi:hypothetical protein